MIAKNELINMVDKTKKLKVLFVEDDEIIRVASIAIFKKFFDDIIGAVDGEDGLNKFISNKGKQYDLIISDINMPKLNGLEMSRKIREIDEFIPILLLTAFTETNYLLDSINIGIDGYLTKPFNINNFFFHFKRILNNIEGRYTKNYEEQCLLETVSKNVILSKTDLKGVITHVSQAFCDISGYTKEELIGQPQSIVRHPDMPMETFMYMWSVIPSGETWEGEIKNLKKDGGHYWVNAIITPNYDYHGNHIGYTAIRKDIASQKEVEILNTSLEMKIEARTKDLLTEKDNMEQILSNILLPMFITHRAKRTIIYANKFAQELYETSYEDIIDAPLDTIYTLTNGPDEIIRQIVENGSVHALEEHITTHTGKEFIGLLSVIPITYNNEDCFIGMTVDITKQKDMENEVRAIHKHTRESIEYAAMIQKAVLPESKLMANYFKDYFVHWMPKDTVGGDIWLFNELRHEDECLLFFIDCTGHGVPGAFVTMLVKAVERQVIAKIMNDRYGDIDISPAWIMGYFNKTLKKLLKQENKDSESNAGWDGGIIYYNKKDKILKFAGAETPLFYIDENKEFQTIKGNRYSVGYKKCDSDYQYKETILEVKEGMKFYCTTDGYLDQNGGEKDFPFGKKRFGNIIKEHHEKPMLNKKKIFINEMTQYEQMIPNNDRNDDMTVIGFEV